MTGEYSKAVRLAHQLLDHAIAEDWPKAAKVAARLNTECDAEGRGDAVLAWCDAFAEHTMGEPAKFRPVKVSGWNFDTGAIDEPLPPHRQWVNELIAARFEGDLARFDAKLAQLNSLTDGYERGRWLSALVESVALTIRTLPYGYTNLGRTP